MQGWSFEPEHITSDGDEENYADEGVGRKEGGVQPRQVAGVDDAVLINQQRPGQQHADQAEPAQVRQCKEDYKRCKHQRVNGAGNPQGAADAEALRNRMQAAAAVEVDILAGI